MIMIVMLDYNLQRLQFLSHSYYVVFPPFNGLTMLIGHYRKNASPQKPAAINPKVSLLADRYNLQ